MICSNCCASIKNNSGVCNKCGKSTGLVAARNNNTKRGSLIFLLIVFSLFVFYISGNKLLENAYEIKLEADKQYEEITENITQQTYDNVIKLSLGSNSASVRGNLVLLDATNPNVMPIEVNDITLVPIRFLADSYNLKIEATDRGVAVSYVGDDERNIMALFTLDDSKCVIDGVVYDMGVVATEREGRIMVPLRLVAEKFLGKEIIVEDEQIIIK